MTSPYFDDPYVWDEMREDAKWERKDDDDEEEEEDDGGDDKDS